MYLVDWNHQDKIVYFEIIDIINNILIVLSKYKGGFNV